MDFTCNYIEYIEYLDKITIGKYKTNILKEK